MRYKIKIGELIFDAEKRDAGIFHLKCDSSDFVLPSEVLDILEAKITEVKEPLRVEFEAMVKHGAADENAGEILAMCGFKSFVGQRVRVTVEEILSTKCSHRFTAYWSDNSLKCTKCGEVK